MLEVAAAVIRDGRGRVLIARRKVDAQRKWTELAGLWEFPGGKREGNETWETCAIRELMEEMNLPIRNASVFAQMDYTADDRPIHFAFVSAEASAEAPLTLSAHTEARWVEPERLGEYAFCPADAAFLRLFGKEL